RRFAPSRKPYPRIVAAVNDLELDIGPLLLLARADEALDRHRALTQGTSAEQPPAEEIERQPVEPDVAVEADIDRRLVDRHRDRMILQVLADPRQVDDWFDAGVLQRPGRADAGQHQQMRAVERPRAQDHFAAAA